MKIEEVVQHVCRMQGVILGFELELKRQKDQGTVPIPDLQFKADQAKDAADRSRTLLGALTKLPQSLDLKP